MASKEFMNSSVCGGRVLPRKGGGLEAAGLEPHDRFVTQLSEQDGHVARAGLRWRPDRGEAGAHGRRAVDVAPELRDPRAGRCGRQRGEGRVAERAFRSG